MFPIYPLEKRTGPVKYVPTMNVRPVERVSFSRISADLAAKDATTENESRRGESFHLKDRYGKDGRLVLPKLSLYDLEGQEEDTYFRTGSLGRPASAAAKKTDADGPCEACSGKSGTAAGSAEDSSGARVCSVCGRHYVTGSAVGGGKAQTHELRGQYVDEKA